MTASSPSPRCARSPWRPWHRCDGELLWDVGAGAGSVAIEWLRSGRGMRAIAIERDAARAARIAANAEQLGVPELVVRIGEAPAALADLPEPTAIFVGGGAAMPGLIDHCWQRLAQGGRLVVNAVTVAGEAALLAFHAAHGGRLLRLGARPRRDDRRPAGLAAGHARHPARGAQMTRRGKLIGLGVGPGDPELLTLKGVRALEAAQAIAFIAAAGRASRAREIARAHIRPGTRELIAVMPMTQDAEATGRAYAQLTTGIVSELGRATTWCSCARATRCSTARSPTCCPGWAAGSSARSSRASPRSPPPPPWPSCRWASTTSRSP